MSEYYTKAQIDSQAAVVGTRIKDRTTGAAIVSAIAGVANENTITDAERTAIGTIEPTKYKGLFVNLAAIPTVGAAAGDYAYIIVSGGDDTLAIWDSDDTAWVDSGSSGSAETAASVKTKYESNANTNAFTDAEKTKLAGITDAADITAWTAALDAALA